MQNNSLIGEKYLVTAALPYSNGNLHVGHIAGAYLPPDIFVRYLRLCGADVRSVSGSDDHGVAILLTAEKEGRSPEEVSKYYHEHQLAAVLLSPYLPFSSEKILRMLNCSNEGVSWPAIPDLIPPGHPINQAEVLFPRME